MINQEAMLARLLELIDDTSIDDPIAVLRSERAAAVAVKQRLAQEMALDNTYRIARVEKVEAYDQVNGNSMGYRDIVIDITRVTNRLLPEYAKQFGLDLEQLRDALASKRKEVSNHKGERFQLYPLNWIDRTPTPEAIAERELWDKEDRAFQAAAAQRQANKEKSKPRNVLERVFSGN